MLPLPLPLSQHGTRTHPAFNYPLYCRYLRAPISKISYILAAHKFQHWRKCLSPFRLAYGWHLLKAAFQAFVSSALPFRNFGRNFQAIPLATLPLEQLYPSTAVAAVVDVPLPQLIGKVLCRQVTVLNNATQAELTTAAADIMADVGRPVVRPAMMKLAVAAAVGAVPKAALPLRPPAKRAFQKPLASSSVAG